jgi:succinate dehydrogenase/fumarate reductase flavoprotein subunit
MSKAKGILAILIFVGIAAFVLGGRSANPAPTAPGAGTTTGVPWSDYAPEVHTRIDGLLAAKDCRGLQAEFNQADANNQATMSRTGHNNAALVGYIDTGMRSAGCY